MPSSTLFQPLDMLMVVVIMSSIVFHPSVGKVFVGISIRRMQAQLATYINMPRSAGVMIQSRWQWIQKMPQKLKRFFQNLKTVQLQPLFRLRAKVILHTRTDNTHEPKLGEFRPPLSLFRAQPNLG